jgi:hypothetical protein
MEFEVYLDRIGGDGIRVDSNFWKEDAFCLGGWGSIKAGEIGIVNGLG